MRIKTFQSKFSAVILCACVAASGCASLAGKQLVGKQAPTIRLYRLEDGSQTTLSEYRGKYTALVFWATTCNSSGPIMRRMSEFSLENRSNPRIKVVSISLDKLDDLQKLKDRIKYDNLVGMDQMFSGNEEYDEAFFGLKGERLPYVVVIDPAGRVVAVDTDDDIVYEYLK